MSTTAIILTVVFSSAFVMNVTLLVCSRIRKHQGFSKVMWPELLVVVLGTAFFPVVIFIGLRELYYRNRPRPVPRKFRKYLKDDTVFSGGRSMSLSEYNATHGRQFTLEQVYGRRYVRNLYKAGKPDFHSDSSGTDSADTESEF